MNLLAHWEALKSVIDQVGSFIDLKAIRDKAEAYRCAFKVAREASAYIVKAEVSRCKTSGRGVYPIHAQTAPRRVLVVGGCNCLDPGSTGGNFLLDEEWEDGDYGGWFESPEGQQA